jgi:hypothetical protein
MKRKVWRKYSSFVLVLTMFLSLLPATSAMAADVPLSCTTSPATFTVSKIFDSTDDLESYIGNGGLTQPVCGPYYAEVTDIEGDIGPYDTDVGGKSYSGMKAYSNDALLTFTFPVPGVYSFYVYYDDINGDPIIDKSVEITYTIAAAPVITGPTTMSLTEGYDATSTGVYTISGTAPVTVTKTSGNAKITWNSSTKKLDIDTGLPAGTYPVVLTASNGTLPDATLTFTLTVNEAPVAPDITGPTLTAGAVSRTSDTEGTVKFTSNEAGSYYYAVVEDGAGEPEIDTSGAGISCTTAETTITNPTGLTAGAKNIYIKVKDAAGNVSAALKIDITAYADPLSNDAGLTSVLGQTITAGVEAGTSGAPKTASISVANGVASVSAGDIVKHDAGATVTFYGTDSSFTTPEAGSVSLTAGSGTDVYIKVAAADSTALYYKVTINRASAHSGGGSGGDSTPSIPATPTQLTDTGVEILVNGKTETAATAATTQDGDRTVTTITVDDKKVEEKLQAEGNNATVTIPVKNDADTVVGQLNGQTVKNMETKEAVLEIKTKNVTYTLPASQVNIDNVSEQIGKQVELKDIKVNVTISAPTQDTVKIVENTANKNNYQVVVKPVEFKITCTSGNKTVEVSKFNGYVERMVAIPDGIDPSKITTGIVLNSDGTFSHVPTLITVINGKYYAKINSLTNSTYSVIWSPKTFKDVEKHWAKDAVNDMGSRLVISGVGNDIFEPDRDISRAEFASIIVKALGLMRPGTGKAVFADVSKADWYYDAVSIAYENGIISGYGNGNFGPMDKITREQAMTMVSRAMKITGLKVNLTKADTEKILSSLPDGANAADYARTNIAACINAGIVSGRDGKAIAPQDNITRAEVAAIVQRLLQKSKLI